MVLSKLGLEECADTLVGGGPIRGISGGQKKRLTIGSALVSLPRVVALDEPTNGLDSANALSLVRYLKEVAQGGVPVVMTLQQPSYELFSLFDDIMLMGNRKLLFHGPIEALESYINELGFRSAHANENPADHYLDITTYLQETAADSTQTTVSMVPDKYKGLVLPNAQNVTVHAASNMWAKKSRDFLPSTIIDYKMKRKEAGNVENHVDDRHYFSSSAKQFKTILRTTFTRMGRDPSNLRARLARGIVMGIVIGTLFLQQDKDQTYARNAPSVIFLWLAMGGMSNLGTVSSLIDEREIFMFQKRSHYFLPSSSLIAGILSGFPYQIAESFIILGISFFMVDLNSSAAAFFTTILTYFSCVYPG